MLESSGKLSIGTRGRSVSGRESLTGNQIPHRRNTHRSEARHQATRCWSRAQVQSGFAGIHQLWTAKACRKIAYNINDSLHQLDHLVLKSATSPLLAYLCVMD
jgi:hypothetical protein